jgi:hypothetical protein
MTNKSSAPVEPGTDESSAPVEPGTDESSAPVEPGTDESSAPVETGTDESSAPVEEIKPAKRRANYFASMFNAGFIGVHPEKGYCVVIAHPETEEKGVLVFSEIVGFSIEGIEQVIAKNDPTIYARLEYNRRLARALSDGIITQEEHDAKRK